MLFFHRTGARALLGCTFLVWWTITMAGLMSDDALAAEARGLPVRMSWAISVEDVVQHPHQRFILVDVRPTQAFEQFHIPDSLNIPLFAISTKAFLRSSPIILLDEGYRPGRLQQACEQIRQAGFEVGYLAGGLNAWKAAGQPLQGDVFAQQHLNHVPPQAVWEEQPHDTWLVIDVTDDANQNDSEQTPDDSAEERLQRTFCPYSEEAPTFLLCLEDAVIIRSNMPELFFLLTNEDGSGYEAIARQLHESMIPHTWYLQGGLRAYRAYVARQARMSKGSTHENTACTTVSGCLPCNQ